jgi:hypothetical protein
MKQVIFFITLTLLASCNDIETKTESVMSDKIKDELLNTKVCDDISIVDLNFNNSPDDNYGTNFTFSGIVTLTGGVDRIIDIRTNLIDNDITYYSFGEETQESMTKRFLQLLNSGTFSIYDASISAPTDVTFLSDESGYYHSRDGDRYSFHYTVSNINHENEFPTISKDSKCDDVIESLTLDKQSFGADFTMYNNRFTISGKIKIDGPNMTVEINGECEDNESSRSGQINWILFK